MKTLLATLALLFFSISAQADSELENELALIENWLGAQRAYDNVPAISAAVLLEDELAWSGGFGLADIETGRPARADTIYGICSISKLFTGVAVMQLRDAGKLSLDDPMEKLLSWFELEQSFDDSPPITMRAVLTHSAGLPRESDYPYWMPPGFDFPTSEAIRKRLSDQSTLYPADRFYQYSNLGLSLAGEVVAEQSGESYDEYVRKNILAPLELNDTDTGFPMDEREPRVATGYAYPGRDHQLQPMPRYDTRGITPAAGFASTAPDLAKFAAWQFRTLDGDDSVLAGNTLREMQRPQWLEWDWSVARGLAFGVYRVGDRTLTGHAGDCPGFNTRLFADPVDRIAVAVMANRNRVDVDGYAAAIFDILDAFGTVDSDAEAENLADYVGRYDLAPWDGEEMVVLWEDGLATLTLPTMDPAGSLNVLEHVEGDRFRTFRADGGPGHEVEFLRDDNGAVTHMKVHSLPLARLP